MLVGCVSFAGSAVAFAKLQELMTGRPVTYPAQQVINAIVALAIVALAVGTLVTGSVPLLAGHRAARPWCWGSSSCCPLAAPTCPC